MPIENEQFKTKSEKDVKSEIVIVVDRVEGVWSATAVFGKGQLLAPRDLTRIQRVLKVNARLWLTEQTRKLREEKRSAEQCQKNLKIKTEVPLEKPMTDSTKKAETKLTSVTA